LLFFILLRKTKEILRAYMFIPLSTPQQI